MSYANLDCKPTINWREYIVYERLRKRDLTANYLKSTWNWENAEIYEEIYLEYKYRK